VELSTAKQTKRTLEGGIMFEDVKEGHGPEAKPGKLGSWFRGYFSLFLLTVYPKNVPGRYFFKM